MTAPVSQIKPASVGMDTSLKYEAQDIDILVPERITHLVGKAEVKYKTMTLKAEKISVDWNTNIVTAEGIPDTTYNYNTDHSDSTMHIKWRGLPMLSDKGDVMNGFKLLYNFKSEKGRIIRGRTQFESGFYSGDAMKKVGEEVINISHGYFTTCENEDKPHFHFRSRRIKVIVKDKVIAKPVVLYLGQIPVGIIPFAVFPHKKGRCSGLVIPSYGQSASEGRFIRGLGYYWAPNDYFDARALIDYYDLSGWMLRGDANYVKRYVLNGSVSGSFTRKDFISGSAVRRWDLRVNHRHIFDSSMSLNVSGTFVSDNSFYRNYSNNLDERLTRIIRSNATFNKDWSEKGLSLSANILQERDIETGKITQTLPQLGFSLSQRRFFNPEKEKRGSASSAQKEDLRWYHSIYYNYSNSLTNQETKGGDVRPSITRYLNHNANLNMNIPNKIFGWLTLGQSLSYRERWYDRYKKNTYYPETDSVAVDTVRGFASYRTFSYSLSSSTKIYGLFSPNIGNIKSVRHVITPTISFSYSPDFSEPRWGYVDTFIDTKGTKVKASRLMDGVSSGSQKYISFSVSNLFQMKTGDGEKEKKFDLFSFNSSSSYNFELEQFKLASLSTSFSSTVVKNLNLNLSFIHDFYKYDTQLNKRVNQLLILQDKKWWKRQLFRMTRFNFSTSITLQGRKKEDAAKSDAAVKDEPVLLDDQGELVSEDEYYDELYRAEGSRFEESTKFSGLDIPWRTNLSFNFSLDKTNPENPSKSYYLNISGMEVQLTRNWRINYTARYDFEKKQIVNHTFTFLRNLHCWEARFVWQPSGIGAPYFYFKINVKSTQLRDLKWEKRGGRSSIFRY